MKHLALLPIKDVIRDVILPPTATPTPILEFHPIDPNIKIVPLISPVSTNTPIPPTPTTPPISPSPTSTPQPSPAITTTAPTPSPLPTIISQQPTSTPTQITSTNSSNYLTGVIIVLLFIILFLAWPKIKFWLHQKTQ